MIHNSDLSLAIFGNLPSALSSLIFDRESEKVH